ncbi:MAG: hypothetical protein WA738_16930 [Candidatus Angelobacter sp.]
MLDDKGDIVNVCATLGSYAAIAPALALEAFAGAAIDGSLPLSAGSINGGLPTDPLQAAEAAYDKMVKKSSTMQRESSS